MTENFLCTHTVFSGRHFAQPPPPPLSPVKAVLLSAFLTFPGNCVLWVSQLNNLVQSGWWCGALIIVPFQAGNMFCSPLPLFSLLLLLSFYISSLKICPWDCPVENSYYSLWYLNNSNISYFCEMKEREMRERSGEAERGAVRRTGWGGWGGGVRRILQLFDTKE